VIAKLLLATIGVAVLSGIVHGLAATLGLNPTLAKVCIIMLYSACISLWYVRGSVAMITAEPQGLLYTYRRGSTKRVPWSDVSNIVIDSDVGTVLVRRKGWRPGLRLLARRCGGNRMTLAWGETAARYWRAATGNPSKPMFESR